MPATIRPIFCFVPSLDCTNKKTRICRNITFPVVFFYWCETWSVTLRKEHRLEAFENWAIMIILYLEGLRNRIMDQVTYWGTS